jgi:hypothetical protein
MFDFSGAEVVEGFSDPPARLLAKIALQRLSKHKF